MIFTIKTIDEKYVYDGNPTYGYPEIEWQIKNNNAGSETQGFMRKVEKGEKRIECNISITDKKENIEDVLLPMLTYPDNVILILDRKLPCSKDTFGYFTFENFELLKEFPSDDGSNDYDQEVQIKLVEVLE